MGAAIAPLMEEFFKDTGFDRKHHNFHYTPGLLLSKVEDPLKYIENKKKLFDQVYPKQYVTGNELTAIKENSGIQGLIIATGTLDSGIDVSLTFINFVFFSRPYCHSYCVERGKYFVVQYVDNY